MRNRLLAAATVTLLVTLGALHQADPGYSAASGKSVYAGSTRCQPCHQIHYKGWVNTFHSLVIQDAKKNPSVIMGDMKAPDLPFRKEDIYFTIGGHWDQRYLTRIGDEYFILPRLWSVQSKKWRPYSVYGWERRPYTQYCVGCHSVGFDPKTKEIVEHAVGCESCHGPGAGHAAHPELGNIVNPATLQKDRAEEICASCHVRGKDLSGEYFFPIGWTPGMELSKYLVPLEKQEGEDNEQAIHRLWDKWRTDRDAQARSRCEVCGIHQNDNSKKSNSSVNEVCVSCHEFEDRLDEHTHHDMSVRIGCADCHVQKPEEMNEARVKDVHSYGYFLIHPQNCWDKEIYKRCGKCHTEKTEQWAYDTYIGWRKPVVIDH